MLTPTGNSLTVDLNALRDSDDFTIADFCRRSRLSAFTVYRILNSKPVSARTIEKARHAMSQKQPPSLADRMSLWMADAGLTQEQAAERADVEIDVIHKLLNGTTRNPYGRTKRKIEAAIKADLRVTELDARLEELGESIASLARIFGGIGREIQSITKGE